MHKHSASSIGLLPERENERTRQIFKQEEVFEREVLLQCLQKKRHYSKIKMLKFIALSSLVLHICTALVHSGDGILFPPPLIKVEGELLGHLKRYGMQSAPSAPVKEYDQPLPTQEFWENHVKPHIPLVLRQAINKSPAIKLWTDKYLTDTYGDLDVLVELKKENRTSSSGRMRLKDFLKLYEREEIYVVSMLPSEMMPEIQVFIYLLYFRD